MALTKLTTDLNIIQALDDEPNDVGGLTAAQLKAEFDESGNTLKAYINETLTVEIDDNLATKAEVQSVVLGQIPDGTITETKLETTLATKINGAAQADDLIDTAINLSDTVKTALAITGTKYVSDALTKLSGAALRDTTSGNKLVDMSGTEFILPYTRITKGSSYVGTNSYGSGSPTTIPIPTDTNFVCMYLRQAISGGSYSTIVMSLIDLSKLSTTYQSYGLDYGSGTRTLNMKYASDKLYMYHSSDAGEQFNSSSYRYYPLFFKGVQ